MKFEDLLSNINSRLCVYLSPVMEMLQTVSLENNQHCQSCSTKENLVVS